MSPCLSHLHTLLDAGALDREGSGIVQVCLDLSSYLCNARQLTNIIYMFER